MSLKAAAAAYYARKADLYFKARFGLDWLSCGFGAMRAIAHRDTNWTNASWSPSTMYARSTSWRAAARTPAAPRSGEGTGTRRTATSSSPASW
jgi:hypothetical protein